jgi:hypothetical protein
VYSENVQKFQTECRLQLAKRIFIDGGFGRIVGMLQASPDLQAASHFFVFLLHCVGTISRAGAKSKEVVLSLLILRDHLSYACDYV